MRPASEPAEGTDGGDRGEQQHAVAGGSNAHTILQAGEALDRIPQAASYIERGDYLAKVDLASAYRSGLSGGWPGLEF